MRSNSHVEFVGQSSRPHEERYHWSGRCDLECLEIWHTPWPNVCNLTRVQSNLAKGRITDMSPHATANGFVRCWLPSNTMVPWTHMSQPLKLHLDRFSRFCRANNPRDQQADRQTDRQTDHAAYSLVYREFTRAGSGLYHLCLPYSNTLQYNFLLRFLVYHIAARSARMHDIAIDFGKSELQAVIMSLRLSK